MIRFDIYEDLSYLRKQQSSNDLNSSTSPQIMSANSWEEIIKNDKNINIIDKRLHILGIIIIVM